MRQQRLTNYQLSTSLRTALLFLGMVGLLGLLGLSLGGWKGLLWASIIAIPFLLLGQRVSPGLFLKMTGARPLAAQEIPGLYQILRELAGRARLERLPRLYYIPGEGMNALTVGNRDETALALTDAILRRLNTREMRAILAHELTHIVQNDVRIMGLVDTVHRMTRLFSTFGLILLFFNVPLLLFGMSPISWLGVALLLIAPTLSGLLQLALSRSQEFKADLGAVKLTGDPVGMAMALAKIEQQESIIARRLAASAYRVRIPFLLRTHPDTGARLERLLELTEMEDPLALQELRECLGASAHGSPVSADACWQATAL